MRFSFGLRGMRFVLLGGDVREVGLCMFLMAIELFADVCYSYETNGFG